MSSANNHLPDHELQRTPSENPGHGTPEPTTRLERRTLELLEETHGDAFRAYLEHVWDGTPTGEIKNEFTNLYWASYPDRKAFIDSVIDGLGWKDSVEDLIVRSAIPPDALNWNYSLLLERLQESYELLDRGGKVHVFLK